MAHPQQNQQSPFLQSLRKEEHLCQWVFSDQYFLFLPLVHSFKLSFSFLPLPTPPFLGGNAVIGMERCNTMQWAPQVKAMGY